MTAAATAGLDRVLTILARFRLPHAIVLLALVAMLHGPMARGQEAASEPARLRTDAIEALVVRVALYPDPLLALVLQGSTLPVQVVQAARFLERRTRDAKQQPDPGWDTSVTGLLNYPIVLAMMNEDLAWTEALGGAVLDQLPDVQAAVQQVRSELQAAGTLVSNERQTVIADESTIRIEPADREVIYVPIYEPVPQPLLPATAAEAAPPAAAPVETAPAPPTAYAAPAPAAYAAPVPTTYAVPQVAYSDPYASFWTHGAAFAGGAVIGGMLGYALGEDDDDDIEIDFDEDIDWDDVDWDDVGGRNFESSRSRDVNIEDSNVIIGGNRSRTERQTQLTQSQLRANQQRKGAVSSRQGSQARAQVARQPSAARPTGAATRATAPAARQGQSRQRVAQQQGAAAKKSAFDARPRQEVRKEASRGSRSRASAQTLASTRPQTAQRQSASRPAAAAPRQVSARPQSAPSRPNAFAGQSRNVQRESARGFQSRGSGGRAGGGGGGGRGGGRGR